MKATFWTSALAALVLSCGLTGAAQADAGADAPTVPDTGWSRIGYGRLIVNDLIGDGEDRWRTGSVASSRIYMRGGDSAWAGHAPAQFGELWELRFLGQVISPSNLTNPAADDRRQAGALSLGLHTHVTRKDWDISVGGDLVVIGPQTNLDDLQDGLHDIFDGPAVSELARDTQIGNKIRPTAVGEVGRNIALSPRTALRPFAEARVGDETLVRAGFDLMVGQTGTGELWLRDPVTGHRYRSMYENRGFGFVVGGDVAYVDRSVYLPDGGTAALKNTRSRLRAGLHWQGESDAVFFGLTYLGEEFEGQDEGQLVGAIRWKWAF